MRLVDTHAHTWGPDTADLPWHSADVPPGWPGGPYLHREHVAAMDDADVDEAVLLPTSLYGRDRVANEYTLRAIEAHPDRLWGVGVAEYFDDETAQRATVRRVLDHERMVGMRMHSCFEYGPTTGAMNRDADWVVDDALDPLYDELAAQNGALFVLPKPEQLGTIASLAAANPQLDVVVEHMAWPDEDTDPNEAPWTDFATLANHDNAFVKVSSIPRVSDQSWPYPDVEPFVSNLLEWFGPERLMLGSDYPWLQDMASYAACLSWPAEADYLSARDLSYLSHRTFDGLGE